MKFLSKFVDLLYYLYNDNVILFYIILLCASTLISFLFYVLILGKNKFFMIYFFGEDEEERKKIEEDKRYRLRKEEMLKDRDKDKEKKSYKNRPLDFIPDPGDRIVGFQKPIGKWTRFVFQQNAKYFDNFKTLLNKANANGERAGFWQLFVKSREGMKTSLFKGRSR